MTASPSDPNLPFQPGELIADKYRVERMLGAGGMGVVVAAVHIDLDRRVAIKLIREELASEPSTVERLMLEARAAAKIRSEHVGKVLDVGKLPSGAPYIVMEYLEGQDLCQLLETRGALKIPTAVDYVMQACEALAEAHAAHIVHRDLKPENLFVCPQPDGTALIKVLDFGISKQLGNHGRRQLTNPSTAVGSPRYMAPEQMQAGEVDPRADIWSLGAILYECLCNEPAFNSDTLPGVCAQVLNAEPEPIQQRVPQVPDSFAQVIGRCLKKDREQRYSDVNELATALAPFGTERAEVSRRRINALLGASSPDHTVAALPAVHIDAQGQTAVVARSSSGVAATEQGFAPSMTTAGRGISVDLSMDPQAVARPQKPLRVWPWIVTALVVAGAAAAVFVVRSGSDSSPGVLASDLEPPAEALTASLTQVELPEADEPATPQASGILPIPDAGPPLVVDVAPMPATSSVEESPKRPQLPRPRPPRPSEPTPPSQGNPNDAWDPNNFGERQ